MHRGTPESVRRRVQVLLLKRCAWNTSFAAAARCIARVLAAGLRNAADSDVRRLGRTDIEDAIRMDSGETYLLANVAGIVYLYDFDWPNAEALYKRAIDSNPSASVPHSGYAGALLLQGRAGEAEAEYARALSVSPLDFLELQSRDRAAIQWQCARRRGTAGAVCLGQSRQPVAVTLDARARRRRRC